MIKTDQTADSNQRHPGLLFLMHYQTSQLRTVQSVKAEFLTFVTVHIEFERPVKILDKLKLKQNYFYDKCGQSFRLAG